VVYLERWRPGGVLCIVVPSYRHHDCLGRLEEEEPNKVTDDLPWLNPDLSKSELRRICAELASERDAAKRDTLRMAEERDLAMAELLSSDRHAARRRNVQIFHNDDFISI
jgi:hypothetical protein